MTLNPEPRPEVEHRLLTVRQPWAKAIVDGAKTVENRTSAFTRAYRGPLWIHAGAAWSERGWASPLIHEAYPETDEISFREAGFVLGVVLGRVEVVDAHHAEPGCCSTPWAESSFLDSKRRLRTDPVHLVLEHPRPCRGPVATGKLGLWRPDPDLALELEHLLEELLP